MSRIIHDHLFVVNTEMPYTVPRGPVPATDTTYSEVEVDIPQLATFLYRIKKLKISVVGSYSVTVDVGGTPVIETGVLLGDVVIEIPLGIYPRFDTEAGFLCYQPFYQGSGIVGTFNFDGVTQDLVLSAQIGLGWKLVGGVYTFGPTIVMSVDSIDPGTTPIHTVITLENLSTGEYMLPFDPVELNAVNTVGADPDAQDGVIDYEISIDEWWEYDPLDGGGPVWDSTTGAKLRQNYV